MLGFFQTWTLAIQIVNALNITKIPKNPGNLPSRQILGVWILLLILVCTKNIKRKKTFTTYCLMIPKNSLNNDSTHHYSWEHQAAFCLVNSSCLAHVSTIFSLCISNKYLFKSMKCQLGLNEMGHKKPLCSVTFSFEEKSHFANR